MMNTGKQSLARMRTALCAALLLALCLSVPFPAAAGQTEGGIPATADWQPPVIDEAAAAAEAPWLLVVKIAQEEIGYIEGPLPNQSKYGDWFCHDLVAWCAEFLTWCADQAQQRYGVELLDVILPYSGASNGAARWFLKRGRFISPTGKTPADMKQWLIGADAYLPKNGYIPQTGDYMWIFYDKRSDGAAHSTVVEGVSRDEDGRIRVHVIEGNNPDRVQRAEYMLDDTRHIYGFGTPVKRAMTALRLYNTGDDVVLLCRYLEKAGIYEPPKKGYDTEVTDRVVTAIRKFNKKYGLPGGGMADISTWMKLYELFPDGID
ncbi:MAG: hypothetical protein CW338_07915 [Clostridiales bacterium]|nr:hypothetical protein [Clostridiales bacterium]